MTWVLIHMVIEIQSQNKNKNPNRQNMVVEFWLTT
jgi:hypothetical protein